MNKRVTLCIIAIAILLGLNVVGPFLAEEGIYQTAARHADIQRGDVRASASPGLKVYAGYLDTLDWESRDFHIGNVPFASITCHLEGVHIDPIESLTIGRVSFSSADKGEFVASVRSADLQDLMVKKVKNVSDGTVSFENGKARVSGIIKLGGVLKARTVITGAFAMEGTKLVFVPQAVNIDGLGSVSGSIHFGNVDVYDFGEFPLGMIPDNVTMEDQLLTIHGKVQHT